MIKALSLLARRPGQTREEFRRHWHEVHAPQCAGIADLAGYAIADVADAPPARTGTFDIAPVDGVASLWFADMEARLRSLAAPATKRWHADGATFIGSSRMFATGEAAPRLRRRADGAVPRLLSIVAMDMAEAARPVFARALATALPGTTISFVVQEQFRKDLPPLPLAQAVTLFAEADGEDAAGFSVTVAAACTGLGGVAATGTITYALRETVFIDL